MTQSHLVSIPPGAHLSDAIVSSAILAGDRGIPEEAMGDAGASVPGAAGGGSTSGATFEFGVDPSLDPELAMVRILLSLLSDCRIRKILIFFGAC